MSLVAGATTEVINDGNQNQCENGHIDEDVNDAQQQQQRNVDFLSTNNAKLVLNTTEMLKKIYGDLSAYLTALQHHQKLSTENHFENVVASTTAINKNSPTAAIKNEVKLRG